LTLLAALTTNYRMTWTEARQLTYADAALLVEMAEEARAQRR